MWNFDLSAQLLQDTSGWKPTNSNSLLLPALNHILSKLDLLSSVSLILGNEKLLNELCHRSFLHPTGIIKIIMTEENYHSFSTRLHIWPNGNRYPQNTNYESIHDHRWDFASNILAGTFRKRLFEVNPSSGLDVKSRMLLGGNSNEKLNYVKELDNTKICEIFETELSVGDSYFQCAHALHLIAPVSDEFSATIFLRTPYYLDRAHVYLPNDTELKGVQKDSKQYLSPKCLAEILEQLTSTLSHQSS
jgi:hypothetical protein